MSIPDQAGNEEQGMPGDEMAAAQARTQAQEARPGPAQDSAGNEPVAETVEASTEASGIPPAGGEPPSGASQDTPASSARAEGGAAGEGVAELEAAEAAVGPGNGFAAALVDTLSRVSQPDWWTRPRLAGVLAVVVISLVGITILFVRYVLHPAPFPDLLPLPVNLDYPPHYLFSIHGVDQPVGVAYSTQEGRLYVAEGGGQRMIKAFDREGNPLGAFVPPRTTASQRAPVYLATDSQGRVFVTDRLQKAIFVYDHDGQYLDTFLSPDLTLGEYVAGHTEGVMADRTFAYNRFEAEVHYYEVSSGEGTLPAPGPAGWSPLGLRIDAQDRALLTDVDSSRHCVREIARDVIQSPSWYYFEPLYRTYGETGQNAGQLLFPNSALADSQGRIHVVDGNNSRISAWDRNGEFLFFYGQGSSEGALNLPRGAAIDKHDRLHVVDAVGQCVRVYDVSEAEPRFLFEFGAWGRGDGEFNYPNDITLDESGRVYIADREGYRIQVWSY